MKGTGKEGWVGEGGGGGGRGGGGLGNHPHED